MTGSDVKELYLALERVGVLIWIDGGWGVDALLGRQTRGHADLDIALQAHDVARFRTLLDGLGFRDVPRDDTSSWNFVMADPAERKIDVHVISFDENGNGILGPPELGNAYPAGALDGAGVVEGLNVRCVTPEFMVKFRTGYVPRPSDYADVKLLCDRFGIDYPEEYAGLSSPSAT
jgi:lincosamide nucleotidyltransferase A/C/D/E